MSSSLTLAAKEKEMDTVVIEAKLLNENEHLAQYEISGFGTVEPAYIIKDKHTNRIETLQFARVYSDEDWEIFTKE